METVDLSDGVQMPILGLGTFRIREYEAVYQSLDAALRHGYRSFDTAAVYQNEAAIGRALKELLPKHGLSRPDVFLTSKLSPRDHGAEAEAACLRSLRELDCGYIDLYLIHWPGKQGQKSEDPGNAECRKQSWEAMEKLKESGKFRAIGVSNYTVAHMKELLAHCRVKPSILQVEFHPRLVQEELLGFCRRAGIHLQAYSPLGVGTLVSEPKVKDLAEKHGRTAAQILLRWAVQLGVGVIPKSVNPDRIANNIRVFDFSLSEQDMEEMRSMNSGTRYCWDPQSVA
ncbi:glyoxal reductase [Latimeria chalumnae]|uniref:Zgc:101765 n=1 Tax=Latimeria chalumnae TaxID=7897 RepID=H3ANZ8_LATCH|nr:PREDICTED: glyoxal reductase-like [Latimeria chalumnae]|eukprot:XP_006007098.1 PREDICTED: glyoxal reductase-like [Latimeria chalumnae]